MVGPRQDNCEALKEICERHHVKRLDLHSSTLTGEDMPEGQGDLNLLVEFMPLGQKEYAKTYFALEEALEKFFGRKIGLVRTDDIKLEILYRQLTRRRTMLYCAEDQEQS